MRFLVFQHIAIEHPGIFRDFFAADGIQWDAIELDEGEAIPDLIGSSHAGWDALWVMGGPMDVWEESEHPWLKAEKQAIRDWVQVQGKPYMGLCLGHQLLGAALGGKVGKMEKAEVGVLAIDLTEAGKADPLFAGIASPFQALQWHGAAVLEPPEGAVILAESPACANQAMRIGDRAYGLQYHTELTARTVGEWGEVPAYACALDETLGQGALARLDAEASNKMADFARDSRRLYDNFMSLLQQRG